jgi:UDP-N-acetyl-L-fucosamine synthase
MKKLKVVTVVGTRPEIIRLSRLIPKLDEYTNHILVHTGQNYDPQLSDVFFKDLELRQPDYYLNVDTSSFGTVMGDTLKKSEEVFLKEKPDAVMILGDTNSAVAAIVAERLHIPVYHMEAGNRSFDNNVPEELNRRMIDHVATFNLAYSRYALNNLLREGLPRRFQFLTGSPMGEVFSKILSDTDSQGGLKVPPRETPFFLLSLHRQENVDSQMKLLGILGEVQEVAETWDADVLVSTHPRLRKALMSLAHDRLKRLNFCEPFGFLDYLNLQKSSVCVISDSGSLPEEASILGFPAVAVRDSIERQEVFDAGSLLVHQPGSGRLGEVVAMSVKESRGSTPEEYRVEDFSDRVLKILFSTQFSANSWKGRTPNF